jgi:hypothetical protein
MKLLSPDEVKTMFVLKYGYPRATPEYLEGLPKEVFHLLTDPGTRAYYGNDYPFHLNHILSKLEHTAHKPIEECHEDFAKHVFKEYLEDFYYKEKLELEEYKRINPTLLQRLIRKLLNG